MEFKGLVIKEFSITDQTFTSKRLKRFKKLCRDSNLLFFKENKSGCLKIIETKGTIFTATDGKKLCLWDSFTGEMQQMITFSSSISDINLAPTSVVISLRNKQLFSLELPSKSLKSLKTCSNQRSSFESFFITFDSHWLIGITEEYEILLLDLHDLSSDAKVEKFISIGEDVSIVSMCAFHKSNHLALALSLKIVIWSIETAEAIQEIQGLDEEVRLVSLMKNDDFLVFSSGDITITVWDLKNDRKVWKTDPGNFNIMSLINDHSGKLFFSADYDVRVWQIDQPREVAVFNGNAAHATSICVTQDDSRLVVGYIDLQVILWSLRTRAAIKSFDFLNGRLKKLVLFSNAKRLAGLTQKSSFYLWGLGKKTVRTLNDHRLFYDFSVTSDSRSIFFIVFNKSLMQLDLETYSTRALSLQIKNKIRILSPSPSLIILSDLNKICLHSMYESNYKSISSGFSKVSSIRSLSLSRSSQFLVVSSSNQVFQVFKLNINFN